MTHLQFELVGEDTRPEILLDIFNSNSGFLEASGGKYPTTADDVAMYFYEELNRENARCLLIRLARSGEVVGTAALAVPYARVGCPWIGLLLIDGKWQGQGIGAEAASMLADTLADEGWTEIQLGVLKANPGAKRFWERQGYRVIGEREDQDKHPVWVMSKSLARSVDL